MKIITYMAGALALCCCLNVHGKDYFVSIHGADDHSGTSPAQAWRSIARASQQTYQAGDKLLFAAGQTFVGQLTLQGLKGTAQQPIIVSTYGKRASKGKARIDAGLRRNGVLILNSQHIHLKHLAVSASTPLIEGTGDNFKRDMRVGILIKLDETATAGDYSGYRLKSVDVHDVFYYGAGHQRGAEEVNTANGKQHYGWGIRVINNNADTVINDLVIADSSVSNVAHTGIKFTSKHKNINQVNVLNNRVFKTGGPGIQLSGVRDARIANNDVSYSGSKDDSRKWGRGSGLWTWSSQRILIERNRFTHANGPGDSAGVHIDFNCNDIIVQYNYSAHNAGGFYEVLGNNYNTAYRYNISVNDGARIKGVNNAFQEGKTFWLSGYNGSNPRKGPFNSYFYNNTIYVAEHIVSKVAIDKRASGVYVANNIFHVVKPSAYVQGDQYKPDDKNSAKNKRVLFSNNVFLTSQSWPNTAPIKDQSPFIGDVKFVNPDGDKMAGYTPTNATLVKDKGLFPTALKDDTKGLYLGLSLSHDILGNPIKGKPDIGAIELP